MHTLAREKQSLIGQTEQIKLNTPNRLWKFLRPRISWFGKGTIMKELKYPIRQSEFEVQAILFCKLREMGFFVRGEVPIYKEREVWINGKRPLKNRTQFCRPDIVIYHKIGKHKKEPWIIIEVKKSNRREGLKKQMKLYRQFCPNVISCLGEGGIGGCIKNVLIINSQEQSVIMSK